MVANDVSIPKECFPKSFRIFEKKLVEGSAYLVFNGIYNGKNI
jgi:hypothetical protein